MRGKTYDKVALVESERAQGCLCCQDHDVVVTDLDGEEQINLQFHHVDPGTKSFNVTSMVSGKNYAALVREIAKCVVLCQACHRKVHTKKLIIRRERDDNQTWICCDSRGRRIVHHRGR